MILFVLDACAAARIYFEDIGTNNLLQIYKYSTSQIVSPIIVRCEVLSTMISAYNNQMIDQRQYRASRANFEDDLKSGKITSVDVTAVIIDLAAELLCKHKVQPGKMGLGGADLLYLATAVHLGATVKKYGWRVILVTSDNALYNAAQDEPDIEAFHFWTCDMGCDCGVEVVPVKGKPTPPNTCPSCGKVCPECRHDLCPSTYQAAF